MHISVEGLERKLHQTAQSAEERASEIPVPVAGDLSLAGIVRLVLRYSQQDNLPTFAGNLTYNAFLAIFPFLLFLVSLLKVAHATSLVTLVVDAVARSLPSAAAQVVRQQVLPEVMSRLTSSPILSVCLALGSLWAVSAVARALMSAMNTMYGVEESRALWKRFSLSLALSVGAAILFLAVLALIVFGSTIGVTVGQTLGSGTIGWWTWYILQWPALLLLALLAFMLLYYYAPDLEQRFLSVGVGATVATIAWLAFSLGFSFVLNHFARYLVAPLYGWFTGLIILLMYTYWSSILLLVGAEVNRMIASNRVAAEERAGPPRMR